MTLSFPDPAKLQKLRQADRTHVALKAFAICVHLRPSLLTKCFLAGMDADGRRLRETQKRNAFGQVYFAFGMRLAFAVAPEMCRLLALRKLSAIGHECRHGGLKL